MSKQRKVKCPDCKGTGTKDEMTSVFNGHGLLYHHEMARCKRCDGSGKIPA